MGGFDLGGRHDCCRFGPAGQHLGVGWEPRWRALRRWDSCALGNLGPSVHLAGTQLGVERLVIAAQYTSKTAAQLDDEDRRGIAG